MSYASFTNSPASTRLPAQSVACGRRVGKSRLTALLVLAAGTDFLLVAVVAYSAAVLYHRQILLDSPGAAKYIQESLLISTQRRVEHDLYYIDNWSLLLDLKIVVMILFSRKVYWNAY